MAAKLTSINPMTKEKLWEGLEATQKDVDKAVSQARNSLPRWALLPLKEREFILINYKDKLLNNKEGLAEAISKETGKPLWESKTEVDAMAGKIDISITAQNQRCPELNKELPYGRSLTRHKPLGVAAVLGPYNFPGHLPNGHIVPALLAGNTVVFKPSELTPSVGDIMAKLWRESGLPEGVLSVVHGGPDTGKALSSHPGIDALFFTGSWTTGKILAALFGNRPDKLLALEMGGNNPLVVGKISDLEAAAYLIIQSAFITSGQRCTCARRLIVPNDQLAKSLLETLVRSSSSIHVGPYTDIPEPFMGPVISLEAAGKLLHAQEALIKSGGKPLLAMRRLQENAPLLSPGILDVTTVVNRSDDEYFGPLLQVIRTDSFSDAIKEANMTQYGLCAGILTEDEKEFEIFYNQCRSGVINWNTPTTGASSAAPFGGVGHSGNYRPSAFYAADYCNYPVASIVSERLRLPEKLAPGITMNR